MYIPKINLVTDRAEILGFMKNYSFAAIITAKNNYPVVSHLPFVATEENDQVILTAHFAKANEQWKDIEANPLLVVFSEPHAYISPKHYDNILSVPTWNYVSVHAYGTAEIISEQEAAFDTLNGLMNTYEKDYKTKCDSLHAKFKLKMLNCIVSFRVRVTDLQAKKKLSQNKNEAERKRIINELEQSDLSNEQSIAAMMKESLNPKNT